MIELSCTPSDDEWFAPAGAVRSELAFEIDPDATKEQKLLAQIFGEAAPMRDVEGGIFCQRLFGPKTPWRCRCGQLDGKRDTSVIGQTCDACGVPASDCRRRRFAFIQLPREMPHPLAHGRVLRRIAVIPPTERTEVIEPGDLNAHYMQLLAAIATPEQPSELLGRVADVVGDGSERLIADEDRPRTPRSICHLIGDRLGRLLAEAPKSPVSVMGFLRGTDVVRVMPNDLLASFTTLSADEAIGRLTSAAGARDAAWEIAPMPFHVVERAMISLGFQPTYRAV